MAKIRTFLTAFLRLSGLFTTLTREIRNVIWAIGIGLASQVSTFMIMLFLGYTTIHGFDTGVAASTQLGQDFQNSISTALTEELLFRLALYGTLMLVAWLLGLLIETTTRISSKIALSAETAVVVVAVALIFGQAHYTNEIKQPGFYSNWSQVFWAMSAGGLILTISRTLSGSIWMPIIIHFVWDFGLGLLNPGGAPNHILNAQATGPAWVHVDGIFVHWLLITISGLGLIIYWRWQASHDKRTPDKRGA